MNLVGLCYDYIGGLPELARGSLSELASSPGNKQGYESELDHIFPVQKAADMISRQVPHRLDKKIRNYIETIEKVQSENKDMPDEALKKMEEALQQKINISQQLNDFENKQSWMFVGVFVFLGIWCLGFFWCYRQKSTKADSAEEVEYNQIMDRKIYKLDRVIKLMQKEEIKMARELRKLKKKNNPN